MCLINLPFDTACESGIIATLLKSPEFILHSEGLKPGYFYHKENGCIYWAISELFKAGIDKIDSFNLTTQLNSNKGVKNIIDNLSIPSIQEFIDLSNNIARDTLEEYQLLVDRVISLSYKRDLYKTLVNYQNICLDEKKDDLDKINNKLNEDLSKLEEQYIVMESIPLLGDKIDDIWEDIEKKQTKEEEYGLPSKFKKLNDYCPFEEGELIIVAAPRKTGKSMYMLNEARHKIDNDVPTAYLDTEMSTKAFTLRLLANLTGIPISKIKRGNYSSTDAELIKQSLDYIKSKPFVHIYKPSWTESQIYSICKILQYKMSLKFVIYDYLKGSSNTSSEQYNELGNKTNFLKNNIAGGLNLSVCAGAQLNRKSEMGDSYKIEQYASTILNLRPKTNDEVVQDGAECGNYALIVKLNRNGEQMDSDSNEYIDLSFKGNTATFVQAKQHEIRTPFDNN